ncbi:Hemerythrin-like domain-containing protein [Allochromatium warmingii]|uniref:Hemerythrin-like domain-containing protein n=1 Tax=Allochromatium warmingii TaxID=61595 RepID=A0A1H3F025_ALLWA|nr:hemerythrin domain-containing protein [Allochromatium warmingii]SDX84200.1 Hemerythrin-like domain-containing protein [Allochromatium warmingii]
MHTIMTRLTQDHSRLRQVLDLLEELLDRFHQGEEPDYALMDELLEYMDSYADIVHHPTEELIFQRLLDKEIDAAEVLLISQRQHAGLSQLTKQFRQSLLGILNEAVLLREDVEAAGRALVGNQRGHLLQEEREAFPLALKHLSAADWAVIDVLAPNADDPVFGAPDPQRFKMLYRRLVEQAQV